MAVSHCLVYQHVLDLGVEQKTLAHLGGIQYTMDLAVMHGLGTTLDIMIHSISQLFPHQFNQYISDQLKSSADWRLCLDDRYLTGMDWQAHSDSGMVYYTYNDNHDWHMINSQDPIRARFNYLAEVILNTAMPSELGTVGSIRRIMWNYYNRSGDGISHRDHQEPGVWSMVYNLTDTDGGTEIQSEFYQGHQGRALIFPSELLHRGQGPRQQPHRFVLNVMFTVK